MSKILVPYTVRKARYKVRYAALIQRLGGKCENCGAITKLSVDHWDRQDWGCHHRKKSSWQRVVIYEREEKDGKLRVLCCGCNSELWVRPKNKQEASGPVPF